MTAAHKKYPLSLISTATNNDSIFHELESMIWTILLEFQFILVCVMVALDKSCMTKSENLSPSTNHLNLSHFCSEFINRIYNIQA